MRPSARSASIAKVSSSAARVWMTSGRPSCRRARAGRRRRARWSLARRVVAVVVEPGLPDRATAPAARPPARSARCRASSKPVGLVRVAADDRQHLVVASRGRGERALDRVAGHADGGEPLDARARARGRPARRPAACRRRGGSGCRSRRRQAAGAAAGSILREELAELADARAARHGAEAAPSRARGPHGPAPPAAAPPTSGMNGCSSTDDHAQALGERVEDRVEPLRGAPSSLASFHGSLVLRRSG